MLKIVLFSMFLICLAGTISAAPRIESNAITNIAVAESKTKAVSSESDELTSEEIFALYSDPKDLRVEKLPMLQVIAYNEVAKKEGVTLDELLFLARMGLELKKSEKEGKSSDEAMNQEAVCDEVKTLRANPNITPIKEMSKTAKAVASLREMCAMVDLLKKAFE